MTSVPVHIMAAVAAILIAPVQAVQAPKVGDKRKMAADTEPEPEPEPEEEPVDEKDYKDGTDEPDEPDETEEKKLGGTTVRLCMGREWPKRVTEALEEFMLLSDELDKHWSTSSAVYHNIPTGQNKIIGKRYAGGLEQKHNGWVAWLPDTQNPYKEHKVLFKYSDHGNDIDATFEAACQGRRNGSDNMKLTTLEKTLNATEPEKRWLCGLVDSCALFSFSIDKPAVIQITKTQTNGVPAVLQHAMKLCPRFQFGQATQRYDHVIACKGQDTLPLLVEMERYGVIKAALARCLLPYYTLTLQCGPIVSGSCRALRQAIWSRMQYIKAKQDCQSKVFTAIAPRVTFEYVAGLYETYGHVEVSAHIEQTKLVIEQTRYPLVLDRINSHLCAGKGEIKRGVFVLKNRDAADLLQKIKTYLRTTLQAKEAGMAIRAVEMVANKPDIYSREYGEWKFELESIESDLKGM